MAINQIAAVAFKIKSFVNQSFFNTESYKNYLEPIVEMYQPSNSLLHHLAKIVAIQTEREDVKSLYLKPNKRWKGFKEGQYVQLGFKINGILYHRIFSISSNQQLFKTEGLIRVTIQRQHMGKVTNHVFDGLQLNTFIQFSEAMGNFTLENETKDNILFIAGGVGITPILSMLSGQLNTKSQYTLMYYASKDKIHLFKEELNNFTKTHKNLKIHLMDTDQEGFLSKEHLQDVCPDFKNRLIYLCGPQAMDNHVKSVLSKEGFEPENLFTESFTAQAYSAQTTVKEVEISLFNTQKKFVVKNDNTILELLEQQKEQPKYGCRMGICNQCTCKKTSGLVYNIQTKRVSDSGEEFIKICSSVPLGDVTLVL
jgi:ferredoxin-NADP reductase